MHQDEDQIAAWVEQDWANKKEMDLMRDIKRVPKAKYDAAIKQLKQIIRTLPRNQKTLFTFKVVNDLSK